VQPVQPEQPKQDRTSVGYATGTDGSLAINDKPAVSPNWSKQLGAIPEGAACTVYTDRKNGSWYWVSYNGVEGYAHSNYITFTKPQPTQPAVNTRKGVVHNTDGTLAINSKPAVSPKWSTQIGAIPEGATCTVYPDKTSGSWYWVNYNGIEGYAHKNYIRLQ
jgi:probable enterotoxin B